MANRGNNFDEYPISSQLDQVGNSGFYISPNEPVSPNDCTRFPNSPYCGGNGANVEREYSFNPLAPITEPSKEVIREILEDAKRKLSEQSGSQPSSNSSANNDDQDKQSDYYSENAYERCVYIYPGEVFGINSLPPIIICKRKDKPDTSSENESDENAPEDEVLISNRLYPNGCILYGNFYNKFQDLTLDGFFLGEYLAIGLLGVTSTDVLFPPCRLTVIAREVGYFGEAVQDGGSLKRLGGYMKALEYYAYDLYGDLIQSQTSQAYVSHKMKINIQGLFLENDPTPANDPNPDGDPMCECADEINDLKKLIKDLKKLIEFEATVPANLASNDNKEVKIKTIPNFLAWQAQQMDALFGQFPIEIEIKDADPNKKGDQKKTVTIPNLSEAIADIYGMQFHSNYWQQVGLQANLCQSAELIAIRNQTLQTKKSLDATNDYLGIQIDYEETKVPSAFNPKSQIQSAEGSSDKWTAFLQPSEYKLQTEKYDGKDTLWDALKNLLFAAGIIKAKFWQTAKEESNRLADDLIDFEKANDQEIDQWINRRTKPDGNYNRGYAPPKITNIGDPKNSEPKK